MNRTFTCPALVNLEQTHLVALDEQGQELSREDMPGEYYGMLDVPREVRQQFEIGLLVYMWNNSLLGLSYYKQSA